MTGWQLLVELTLICLLTAMLFHALRLERALGAVRRDRAELSALLESFNESTQQAESGIAQLRAAAEGAGRQIARQIDAAQTLSADLLVLTQRGESVADRLDSLVRNSREPEPYGRGAPSTQAAPASPEATRVRSQAERDLLRALRVAR